MTASAGWRWGVKQRALLGFLLLHANEAVSTDRLVDELWGDEGLGEGSKALQVAVSRLRRVLEPGRAAGGESQVLVTRPPGYELRAEPGRLDVERFEALVAEGRAAFAAGDLGTASDVLREALGLWRGPPLADLTYESFAQVEIARLEELRLTALEERIEAELALGRHAELIPELEALRAKHPLRERLTRQLMLALYRTGRQPEALEACRTARDALVELGIELSSELQELERAILNQDSSLDLAEREVPSGRRPDDKVASRRRA